jgi:hypothetical protein
MGLIKHFTRRAFSAYREEAVADGRSSGPLAAQPLERGAQAFLRVRRRLKAFWHAVERFGDEQRTVLAVTGSQFHQTQIRTLALEQGWRLLFAPALEDAVNLRKRARIAVVLFDPCLTNGEWQQGLRTILDCAEPTCVILLTDEVNASLRRMVLEDGGFDVASVPCERDSMARIVNGALAVANAADWAQRGLSCWSNTQR